MMPAVRQRLEHGPRRAPSRSDVSSASDPAESNPYIT